MAFKSNKQRRGFFGRLDIKTRPVPEFQAISNLKFSNISQTRVKRSGGRTLEKPPLTLRMRNFLAKKISKNIKEGKPTKQAIAIAFSQTRKKFGNLRLKK